MSERNKYYSQYGEDQIIEGYFNQLGLNKGTFFEMGAGDGVKYSNTKLLADKGWSGLLVEADSNIFKKLKKNYFNNKNITISNERCSKKNSLNEIFDKNNIKNLDLLSLDIDGIDLTIIKLLNFNKYRPKIIIIEYNLYIPIDVSYEDENNTGNQSSALAINKFLNSKNFKLVNFTFSNLIFIDKNINESLKQIELDEISKKLNPIKIGFNNSGEILLFDKNNIIKSEYFRLPSQKKFIMFQPIPKFLRRKDNHHGLRFPKNFYSHWVFLFNRPLLFFKYIFEKLNRRT